MVLRPKSLASAFSALGSPEFGRECFSIFGEYFDLDHWALFRYNPTGSVNCVSTASRANQQAAERNCDSFANGCYRFDPSLQVFRQQQTIGPCMVKMSISDIVDLRYRHCFELTQVRERLSMYWSDDSGLLQLSVFRSQLPRSFSAVEMNIFASLSQLIIVATVKHESIRTRPAMTVHKMAPSMLEQRLDLLGSGLSRREREVCSRALLGHTIEDTAQQLGIGKTSVITYRQRAYQKLNVSRLSDLMRRLCEADVAAGTAARNSVAHSSRPLYCQ
jgi:DNA-binding CsgD family transcriptional regulator